MSGDRVLITVLVLLGVGGVLVIASKQRELKHRWAVWIVVAVVVGAAGSLPHGMPVLALMLAVVAGWEYARLTEMVTVRKLVTIAVVIAPVVAAMAVSWWPGIRVPVVLGAAVLAPPLFRVTIERRSAIPRTLGGVGLIGLPLAALSVMPARLAVPAILAVSVADVAAWVGGRTLGRRVWWSRPISVWSPNKTRGGALFAMTVGGLVLVWVGPWWLAPLVPVSGMLGDLRESRLKRTVGVKDAAAWLPGFGGLLDRVDSVLGAAVGIGVTLLVDYAVVIPIWNHPAMLSA